MNYLKLVLLCISLYSLNAKSEEFEKSINEDYKAYSDSLEHNITSITYLNDDKNYKTYLLSSKSTDNNSPIFQIGSVSKLFTTQALCNLVVAGDLKMETTLKEMLPFVLYKDTNIANITMKQLANHTSGLPRLPVNIFVGESDTLQPYENYTATMLYNFLGNYSLVRKPGKSYEYSNLGVGILGHILDLYLQKHKNISLEKYIEKEIFDKVGMKDTELDLSKNQQKRLAQPYNENNEVPAWKFDVLKWAGQYYSTSQDLAKYLYQFITDTPVFDKEVIAMAKEITFVVNSNMRLSYGWHITPLGNSVVYWHNGNTYGNSAFIGFTDKGKFIALLTNSNRVLDNVAVDLLSKMK